MRRTSLPTSRPPSLGDGLFPIIVILLIACLLGVEPVRGQVPVGSPTGRAIAGLPALNYDADEGLGYGAILQLFDYGTGVSRPYRYTVQPTVFLTTKGRRDLTLFVDAPALLPAGWRLTAHVGDERHRATPYYGIGNDTRRDEHRETDGGSYFYRYERHRRAGTVDLQHRLGALPLRVLAGGGVARVSVDPLPFESSTTLLAEELGGRAIPATTTAWLRAGLVVDTRDRETGPTRGRWAELLLQRAGNPLGGDHDFTRVTAAWREYLPLGARATLATRVVAQQTTGALPLHELSVIQGSWRPVEGLGGAGSVRGLPKNRYVGKAIALYNSELRWRAADFTIRRRTARLTLSGFVDAGRVWDDRLRVAELTSDLHAGQGVGARLALGPDFVVALDVGRSREVAAAAYVGLGYAF